MFKKDERPVKAEQPFPGKFVRGSIPLHRVPLTVVAHVAVASVADIRVVGAAAVVVEDLRSGWFGREVIVFLLKR